MEYDDNETSADERSQHASAGSCEVMLRAEIGFWRELLSSCDQTEPPENVERMQQALALAELRFLQLQRDVQAGRLSCPGPVWASRTGSKSLH
jgi:hypothetical protein